MTKRQIFLSIILSVIGLTVWIAVGKLSKEVEPWDSIDYYRIGLPIMFGASAIAGFIEPKFPLRWGLLVVVLQPIALFIQGNAGPYAFIGLFFFLCFFVLAWGCAYGGKIIRKYAGK